MHCQGAVFPLTIAGPSLTSSYSLGYRGPVPPICLPPKGEGAVIIGKYGNMPVQKANYGYPSSVNFAHFYTDRT